MPTVLRREKTLIKFYAFQCTKKSSRLPWVLTEPGSAFIILAARLAAGRKSRKKKICGGREEKKSGEKTAETFAERGKQSVAAAVAVRGAPFPADMRSVAQALSAILCLCC
jgi:hypothetical protein